MLIFRLKGKLQAFVCSLQLNFTADFHSKNENPIKTKTELVR